MEVSHLCFSLNSPDTSEVQHPFTRLTAICISCSLNFTLTAVFLCNTFPWLLMCESFVHGENLFFQSNTFFIWFPSYKFENLMSHLSTSFLSFRALRMFCFLTQVHTLFSSNIYLCGFVVHLLQIHMEIAFRNAMRGLTHYIVTPYLSVTRLDSK